MDAMLCEWYNQFLEKVLEDIKFTLFAIGWVSLV